MMKALRTNFFQSTRTKTTRNQNPPTPFDPKNSLKTGLRVRVMPADPKPIFATQPCADSRRPRPERKIRNRNSPMQFEPSKWLQTQTRPQDHAPRSQADEGANLQRTSLRRISNDIHLEAARPKPHSWRCPHCGLPLTPAND